MASRPRPVLLTAALAVVAHLVLLFAPLTCACGDEAADAAAMTACCCKPGDPPMPCSTGGSDSAPGPGGCASARATCTAEVPDAIVGPVAPAVALLALPPATPAAAFVEPRALPLLELDTGPPAPRIALVLTRCSVIRV